MLPNGAVGQIMVPTKRWPFERALSGRLSIAGAPVYPQSVSVGNADTGSIDMQTFARAVFILTVGAFGASATVDMKLRESADDSTYTDVPAPLTNRSITQLAAAIGANKLASLEILAHQLSPGMRYVKARVSVGTASTVLTCLAMGERRGDVVWGNDIAAVRERLVANGLTGI